MCCWILDCKGHAASLPNLSPPIIQRHALTPNTPVTPVVNNRRLIENNASELMRLALPYVNDDDCGEEEDADIDEERENDDDDDSDKGIPKTIQTPSSDAKGGDGGG